MERIYTFDPLASPIPFTGTVSSDEATDDDSPDIDVSRMENVYKALMSTLLDIRPAIPQDLSTPVTEDLEKEVTDVGNVGTDAAGGVKNAKRRKMDKKKAKREDQKREAEVVVDVVEFKLFWGKPVKPVSLLPSEEPTWITPYVRIWEDDKQTLTSLFRNPRHVPLSEEEQREMRERIGSVVVEGSDVLAAAGPRTSKRKLEEYKLGSTIPSSTIIHLKPPRKLPPFSKAFTLTHPGYTASHPSKPLSGKKSNLPSISALPAKPLDPLRTALKRGPTLKASRTAVHIQFTNNGKILPATTKKEASSVSVPMSAATAHHGSSKEEKAHLRRIARRAHRLGIIPQPTSHPHQHITPSTHHPKPPSPWTNPFLGAHRFWAPAEGTGGKSGGYAVGFAGSLEGVREGEGRRRRGGVYVRDRMT